MKKAIIIISFSLIAGFGHAQEKRTVSFGIAAQANMANLIFEEPDLGESERTFNFSLGGNIFYAISPRVELRSGLKYVRAKAQQKDYSLRFPCDIMYNDDQRRSYLINDFTIHYLSVPLAIKLKMIGEKNHLYGIAGLETSFKIADDPKILVVECDSPARETTQNNLFEVSDFLIGINGGFGMELNLVKKTKAYCELQLQYGLTKLYKEVEVVLDVTNNARMLEFGLLVGVKF